jgi:hypothetical protein
MFKKVVRFFDKLEDWVRAGLSRTPILYAIVGAVGIILVWKGVWETAGYIPGLWGPGSVVIGLIILFITGLLVSFFIGDSIIISGLKRDKKLVEKSEKDILTAEKSATQDILAKISHLEDDIHMLTKKENSEPQQPLL